MKWKLGTAVSALVATGVLILVGCAGATDAAKEGTLTLAALGEPQSYDPAQAKVAHALPWYQAVYDTLLLRQPDGTLSPMLATEWSYNDDDTVLTLTLRHGVTFSDGQVFNAEAVVTNLTHFKTSNGPQVSQLAEFESATAVDDDTVRLQLNAPDPAFEYYLSQAAGFMGSPPALGTESIARRPVGSGPYVLSTSETVEGSQYVFTPRQGYWNPGLQKFKKIVLRPMTDVTARANGLVSGQLDGALLDARTAPHAVKAGLSLIEYEVNWEGLLLMDRDGRLNPALADLRVRQAINYAVDKKTILDQINGGHGTVTSQVFGPGSGAWVPELEDRYPYDPVKARQLLSQAGYADGLTLRIPTTTDFESMMAALSQNLSDVGITLDQVSVPFANFQTDLGAGKFPVAYFRLFQGEPWVAINQLISTNALYNPFKSSAAQLDALVGSVRDGGADASVRAQNVDRYITEQAWFAPFYRSREQYFTSSRITVQPQVQQIVPSIYNYAPARDRQDDGSATTDEAAR